jgi:hypothetical protein
MTPTQRAADRKVCGSLFCLGGLNLREIHLVRHLHGFGACPLFAGWLVFEAAVAPVQLAEFWADLY